MMREIRTSMRSRRTTNVSVTIAVMVKRSKRRKAPSKQQVSFTTLPKSNVPKPDVVAKLAAQPTGSQWDDALKAVQDPTIAIEVTEKNERLLARKKSTLQTIAKNRSLRIEIQSGEGKFFAWMVTEPAERLAD